MICITIAKARSVVSVFEFCYGNFVPSSKILMKTLSLNFLSYCWFLVSALLKSSKILMSQICMSEIKAMFKKQGTWLYWWDTKLHVLRSNIDRYFAHSCFSNTTWDKYFWNFLLHHISKSGLVKFAGPKDLVYSKKSRDSVWWDLIWVYCLAKNSRLCRLFAK